MIFLLVISFILGLCIGSFLNVVIYRLEKEEGFTKGRSYCPRCKHQLAWLDLVPVLSFLFLGGRCRYCRTKISWQYPLVELAGGCLFLAIMAWKGATLDLAGSIDMLFLWYAVSALLVIFVYDLKYYLIPDRVLFPAIAIAFTYRFFEFNSSAPYVGFATFSDVWPFFVAAFLAFAFFAAIYGVSSGRWMGFGDVKLALLLGLLLGLPAIFTGLFLAFLSGAVVGTALLFLKKKGLKSEVPFAPFLIAGTFVAMVYSPQLIQWYTGLILMRP